MSTLILVATGSLGGVIGAAAMFIPAKLCRDDAHTFMERGEQTFGRAEKLVAEHERTRDLPWHYADEHVTGEVLAVASVSATPALSAESHEDEEAAEENDDHRGGLMFAVVAAVWGGAELVQSRTPLEWWRLLVEHLRARRASRDRLDGEETPLTDEAEMQRRGEEADDLPRQGLDEVAAAFEAEIAAEIAELTGENPRPYVGRHWGADVQHTNAWPLVPAQRDGGEN